MTKTAQQLHQHFPKVDFKYDYHLHDKTYFKIGGPAEVYLESNQKKDIIKIVKFCFDNNIKLTILGGASNVIVSDRGITGLVLHLLTDNFKVENHSDNSKKIVRVDSGIKMAVLVRKTIDAGLTGLEYFLGVPGTLGGAIYNNAHYLQHLISQYIYRVEVINGHGQLEWIINGDCGFDYDLSRFQKTKEIILGAEFILNKGDVESSQNMIREATIHRAETQPLGQPSSGCIFQNVSNNERLRQVFSKFRDKAYIPAGYIIDQAGLKGYQHGGIKISQKHAAFMINTGNGTASEIRDLINIVKRKVRDKYDIELKEEVFWLE